PVRGRQVFPAYIRRPGRCCAWGERGKTGTMADQVAAPRDGTTPLLFSPLLIRGVLLKNRIMASPMCQYLSVDGHPQDWHHAHLGRLAIGGAGLVFHEEAAVEARGRKTYDCAGIWSDDHISSYRRLTALVRQCGAVPAI